MEFEQVSTEKPKTEKEMKEMESYLDPIQKAQSEMREKTIDQKLPNTFAVAEKLGMTLDDVMNADIEMLILGGQPQVSANLKGHKVVFIYKVDNNVNPNERPKPYDIQGSIDRNQMTPEHAKAIFEKYNPLFNALSDDAYLTRMRLRMSGKNILDGKYIAMEDVMPTVLEEFKKEDKNLEADPYLNAVKDLL